LEWIRANARDCVRVVFVDRAAQPLRSEPYETRDQAMFHNLQAVLVDHPDAKLIAYLGLAHVLQHVEVRDGVRTREGVEFTIPTVPAIELLRRWGIDCYTIALGGVDPQQGRSDPFSETLHSAGVRRWGLLVLHGTATARASGLVHLGGWYAAA